MKKSTRTEGLGGRYVSGKAVQTLRARWGIGRMSVQGLLMALLILLFFADDVLAYPGICEGKNDFSRSAPDYMAMSIICEENDLLPYLDRLLNGYYRAAMERSKDRKKLRKDQLAWLKRRNACKDGYCIAAAYHKRIIELTLVPAIAAVHEIKSWPSNGRRYILTRKMGLKNFDGGGSDYDIVIASIEKLADGRCNKLRLELIGTGFSVFAPCTGSENKWPNWNENEFFTNKPIVTFDNKILQLFEAYVWQSADPLEIRLGAENLRYNKDLNRLKDDSSVGSYLPDSSWLWRGFTISEPLRRPIGHWDASGRRLIWEWLFVTRTIPAGNGAQSVINYHSVDDETLLLLSDGSILIGTTFFLFRINSVNGTPYDAKNIRHFDLSQSEKWKKSWTQDYLKQTPACGNDIMKCPDMEAMGNYFWQCFNEEMNRQFATSAQ